MYKETHDVTDFPQTVARHAAKPADVCSTRTWQAAGDTVGCRRVNQETSDYYTFGTRSETTRAFQRLTLDEKL